MIEAAVVWPFQKQNGFKFTTAAGPTCLHNGHSPTDRSAWLGVTAVQRPWPLAKAKGFIQVRESLTGIPCLSYHSLPDLNAPRRSTLSDGG
jgi:hypothetical protein